MAKKKNVVVNEEAMVNEATEEAVKKATVESETKEKVRIKPFKKESMLVTIKGDCDLILNKMTDEAIEDIKSTQTKTAKGTKEPINMWQRLVGGLHWMDGKETDYTEEGYYHALEFNRVGYDASGIKKGICDAAVRVLGESKSTIINANIQIVPEKQNLVPITFKETEIDESVITNWKGNAFLTYRTIFRNWTCSFVVEYLPDNISRDQVIELLQAMGFAGGIGAHRVGLKGGTNGKFHVEAVEMV